MSTEANLHAPRFAPYAEAFEAFASTHNLHIEKYTHEAPLWSFCFAHPRGGQAKLDLSIDEEGNITLASVWWIDSFAEFTRSLRWGPTTELAGDQEAALTALRDALHIVAAWNPGEWTRVADGYEPIWGQYSEAQFEAMTPQWPTPML